MPFVLALRLPEDVAEPIKTMNQPWPVHDRFLELHSRWMTLIGEHLQDSQGQILDYWRIEKADSAIVLPIQGDRNAAPAEQQILLPAPSYRPGVGHVTLDFPGGRVVEGQKPEQAAIAILKRELDIEFAEILQLIPLNSEGWAINSSFSNQKLFGFVAYINSPKATHSKTTTSTYPTTSDGIQSLLHDLICLQCRAVLLEWWLSFSSNTA